MKLLVCIIFAAITWCNAAKILRINDPFRKDIRHGCEMKEKMLVCDCTESINKDVILEASSMPTETTKIAISDCETVVIGSGAIKTKPSLREISVENISNLILKRFSVYRRTRSRRESLFVKILNTNITNIPSFTFSGLKDLVFVNVGIKTISPYAISYTTGMSSLRFFGCKVDRIEKFAIRKVMTSYLVINGGHFISISSNAFSEIYISDNFFIMYTKMENVQSKAFNIGQCGRMSVSDTYFSGSGAAFNVQTPSASFGNVFFS